MPKLTIDRFDLGQSSRPDFLTSGTGYLRRSVNCRHRDGFAGRRQRTDLLANLAALDPDTEYAFIELDDVLVAVGDDGGGGLEILCFDGEGTAGTVYQQAEMTFNSGGTYEIQIGDTVTGATSGATGVVRGLSIVLDAAKTWALNAAEGTLIIRWTSPGTPFQNGENLDVGANLNVATLTSDSTAIGFSYLGADVSNIRLYSIEDSVFVLNIAQEVGTLPAPTDTVDGEVSDYESLLKKYTAALGEIYRTLATSLGFPAGHYQCTEEGDAGDTIAPEWKRIPKPSQEDALYDKTTMPHRLLRVSDSPLVLEWAEIPVKPRLSGGDVDGIDDTTGEEIIRNKAVLKGRTIQSLTIQMGSMFLGLDTRELVISRRLDFFNWWLNDILQTDAADRIVDSIVSSNAGSILHLEAAGDGVFVALEHAQAQYSTNGEALVAGGEGLSYNGMVRIIGRYESDLTCRPTSSGGFVFMVDAARNLRGFLWRADAAGGRFERLPLELSLAISDDFVAEEPTRLVANNNTLYVLTASGPMWLYEVTGVARDGVTPVGSWGQIVLDESIAHCFGFADRLRLVTRPADEGLRVWSLLSHPDFDEAAETGFAYPMRLDRRESIDADSYESTPDQTIFTLASQVDPDTFRLVLAHDTSRLVFQDGDNAIIVGNTVTGATSGAAGIVTRITITSGSFGTADAAGVLDLRKTTDARFVAGETIRVGVTDSATAQLKESRVGELGQVLRPLYAAIAFDAGNDAGDDGFQAGDTLTGATSGATLLVSRIRLDSGTWAGGDAAGVLVVTPISGSPVDNETFSTDGAGGGAGTAVADGFLTMAVFRGDWDGSSHHLGRTSLDYVELPPIWNGMRSDDVLINAIRVFHDRTSDYTVRLSHPKRADRTYSMTAKRIGNVTHGADPLETGMLEILAGDLGRDLTIRIETQSVGQFRISGIELDVEAVER